MSSVNFMLTKQTLTLPPVQISVICKSIRHNSLKEDVLEIRQIEMKVAWKENEDQHTKIRLTVCLVKKVPTQPAFSLSLIKVFVIYVHIYWILKNILMSKGADQTSWMRRLTWVILFTYEYKVPFRRLYSKTDHIKCRHIKWTDLQNLIAVNHYSSLFRTHALTFWHRFPFQQ